jgi:hypothetical protein
MCYPPYAHDSRCIVNDVHDAPVTDADALLILVALELFASYGPGSFSQCFEFTDNAGQQIIRQRFEFPPCGGLYVNGVTTHGDARASRDRP